MPPQSINGRSWERHLVILRYRDPRPSLARDTGLKMVKETFNDERVACHRFQKASARNSISPAANPHASASIVSKGMSEILFGCPEVARSNAVSRGEVRINRPHLTAADISVLGGPAGLFEGTMIRHPGLSRCSNTNTSQQTLIRKAPTEIVYDGQN
jgi:hypothetical protein